MHRNEIIGFLSGFKMKTCSTNNKDIIVIHDAVPCQAAEFSDGNNNVDYSKNVEMEPECAQRKCEEIKNKG